MTAFHFINFFMCLILSESECEPLDSYIDWNVKHYNFVLSILSNRFESNFITIRIIRGIESNCMANCSLLHDFRLRTWQRWCDQRVSVTFDVATNFETFLRHLLSSQRNNNHIDALNENPIIF